MYIYFSLISITSRSFTRQTPRLNVHDAHAFHLNNNTYLTTYVIFFCVIQCRDHSIQEAKYILICHLSMCLMKHTFSLSLSCTHTSILSYFLSFIFSSAKIQLVIFLKLVFSNCVRVSFSRDLFRRQSWDKESWNVKPQSHWQQIQQFRI